MAVAEAGGAEFVGYSKLANMMATNPDAAIFRRFRFLSIMNILRLQSELQDLESQLKDIWQLEQEEDDFRKTFRSDFRYMREQLNEDSIQYDILREIGEKLKEYHEALQSFSPGGSDAAQPSNHDLEGLRQWIALEGGNFLDGIEEGTWKIPDVSEYFTMRPTSGHGEDGLSELLNGKLLTAYTAVIGRRTKSEDKLLGRNIRIYDERKIARVGDAIVAIFSAALPTVAILVLYFVKSMLNRIGLVVVFTSIFAAALAIFTNAKRIEIFSATAAFAAVEVVFVGSTSGAI
ncbi:hypothetical protein F5B22DRAFT_603218 [Xylaria bambusicola]|uniref:uncharacterized protein n=1 Tax=Xylaria bambusicola TaxID=326684 RepID=UPI0020089E5E|nr:uncharacterized protein F5B22DRAFT_603218 [Xylaria bambusicola]KAI0517497.1 hypothetical protein F5B22DRAFT_603218 [Xylaria bambusicola]